MGTGHHLWQRITQGADLPESPMPGLSIVEIAGDGRVLVENHRGVTAYNTRQICIRVKFGGICVEGTDLELLHMSKEQLVIQGQISSVTLQRRA